MIKVKTVYTKDVMLKYPKFHAEKTVSQRITYVVLEVLMLAFSLMFILTAEDRLQWAISVFVFAPLFLLTVPVTLKLLPLTSISRGVIGCVNTYEFGDEDLLVTSNSSTVNGQSRLKYSQLDVYETQDAFFLYVSRQQAFIVNKAEMTEQEISELQSLLREKVSADRNFVKTKKSKYFSILVTVAAVAVILAAIFSFLNPYSIKKDFSKDGITITLTKNFHEEVLDPFHAVYSSKDVAVFCVKEEFSLLDDCDLTVTEYAEFVIEYSEVDAVVKEKDDLVTFSYIEDAEGEDYYYFASFYKGSDAYWTVQFACKSSEQKALEPTIVEYAQSVIVD